MKGIKKCTNWTFVNLNGKYQTIFWKAKNSYLDLVALWKRDICKAFPCVYEMGLLEDVAGPKGAFAIFNDFTTSKRTGKKALQSKQDISKHNTVCLLDNA